MLLREERLTASAGEAASLVQGLRKLARQGRIKPPQMPEWCGSRPRCVWSSPRVQFGLYSSLVQRDPFCLCMFWRVPFLLCVWRVRLGARSKKGIRLLRKGSVSDSQRFPYIKLSFNGWNR